MAQGDPGAQLASLNTWIVDTGPLVAYLNPRDPSHASVAGRWDRFTGRLVTTGAVITETMHFVAPHTHGPRHLAELVDLSGMEVYDLTRAPELMAAAALMERYHDTPMDFADATLLLLAEALSLDAILTLDHRGFSAYRTRDGRALQSVLRP